MRLIDSHCHVNAERFADDAEDVVEAARLAGLERILVPGWNVASSRRALDLVDRVPWLDAAVGVHPHDAAKVDEAGWTEIASWASDDRVVAIGETGLDYDRVFSPIPDQLTNLRRNLALASETGKPAILHCRSAAGRRDAQDQLLEEIRGFGPTPPPVVIHSFSGPVDYARAMLDLGASVSFSGLVFRRGEEASAEVAALTPARPSACRDRFAVPCATRCPALAKRTGICPDHRRVGRGAVPSDTRGARCDTGRCL